MSDYDLTVIASTLPSDIAELVAGWRARQQIVDLAAEWKAAREACLRATERAGIPADAYDRLARAEAKLAESLPSRPDNA
jgi:predicted nucleotidyltransferase